MPTEETGLAPETGVEPEEYEGLGEVALPQSSGGVTEEESEVHTEVLREKAARGQEALKELTEILQNMKELVAASEAYWTGDTAGYFREEVAKGFKGFEADLEALAGYPRELIAYADRHEGVITQANALAAGVEDVVWPED